MHLGRIPLTDTRPRDLDIAKPRSPDSAQPRSPNSAQPRSPNSAQPRSPDIAKPRSPDIALSMVPRKQESPTKDMEKLRVALPENYLQPTEAKMLVQLSRQPGSPLTKHAKGKVTFISFILFYILFTNGTKILRTHVSAKFCDLEDIGRSRNFKEWAEEGSSECQVKLGHFRC
jgi:hypothetical protein